MSIKTIAFTVQEGGITPSAIQDAGVQGDIFATQLEFTVDPAYYKKMSDEAVKNGASLVYRFDMQDSTGNVIIGETADFESNKVLLPLGLEYTANGGTEKIFMCVTAVSKTVGSETLYEVFSYPANIRFETKPNTPPAVNQSLSAVTKTATDAAKAAAEAAETAQKAKAETVNASVTLRNSQFVFDGNGVDVSMTVDAEMSDTSTNPVQNKVISQRFSGLNDIFAEKDTLENLSIAIAKLESYVGYNGEDGSLLKKIFPVGCYVYLGIDEDGELKHPNNLGYPGTWQQTAQGRCLIGAGTVTYKDGEASKTAVFTGNTEGGEVEHTMTINEMPSHSHKYPIKRSNADVDIQVNMGTKTPASENVSTSTVGGGQAMSLMQPYLVVGIWQRIE